MKFSLTLKVRVADRNFLPLEKAKVICNNKTAMHKDGGYYIFTSPVSQGDLVKISCVGYNDVERVYNSNEINVYLERKDGIYSAEMSLLCAEEAKKGSTEIKAISVGAIKPVVLASCVLKNGKSSIEIADYNSINGIITLNKPLSKAISQGEMLSVEIED